LRLRVLVVTSVVAQNLGAKGKYLLVLAVLLLGVAGFGSLASAYTVTIPETINLSGSNDLKGTGSATVAIDNTVASVDNVSVGVALTAGQTLKLTTAGDSIGIPYTVKNDTSNLVLADGINFVDAANGAMASQTLYFETGIPKFSGLYTGTLNFTINVVDAPEPATPALDVANTAPGSEITFANAQWRILATDIDDTVAGNQALIIKVDALKDTEMGTGNTGNITTLKFLSPTAVGALPAGSSVSKRAYYYFDSDGSNGYEDSGLQSDFGLRGAIDYYYTHSIANDTDDQYVNAVTLNDPDLDAWNFDNGLEWTYGALPAGNVYFNDYYKNTNYKTTLGSTKQAFALSYGDINSYMSLSSEYKTSLLHFSSASGKHYWLRSPANRYNEVGAIYDNYNESGESLGELNYHSGMTSSLLVRPALVINIK
jgi:hypothetical protein